MGNGVYEGEDFKKVSAWKRGILSQGVREVLIKAIACAFPIYTMQCFKVPRKVCDEINGAVARFWWGQE